MTTALGWIGDLAHFLASFFPRLLIIQSSHGGVKYVHGRRRVKLDPGLHLYWPIVTPVETCAVVRQVLNMPTQLLETSDGQAVVVGCVVEYEVTDVIVFLSECEEPFEAIAAVSCAAVREVVVQMEYEGDTEPDEMDHLLRRSVTELLAPYGVKVLSARLSDFAAVRPIHLTGIPDSA